MPCWMSKKKNSCSRKRYFHKPRRTNEKSPPIKSTERSVITKSRERRIICCGRCSLYAPSDFSVFFSYHLIKIWINLLSSIKYIIFWKSFHICLSTRNFPVPKVRGNNLYRIPFRPVSTAHHQAQNLFFDIFLQNSCSPNPEFCSFCRINTVAHRNNCIEVVKK